MALTTLKEDLLQEFTEECELIDTQMKVLDPLGISLRRPAAQQSIGEFTLLATEYACYALFVGGIIFMFMASTITPFSAMSTIYHSPEIGKIIETPKLTAYIVASYGIMAVALLLILVIGRMAGSIRSKNEILEQAGKDVNAILEQHLQRKAALDIVNQRHGLGIMSISRPAKPPKVGLSHVTFDDEEEEEN